MCSEHNFSNIRFALDWSVLIPSMAYKLSSSQTHSLAHCGEFPHDVRPSKGKPAINKDEPSKLCVVHNFLNIRSPSTEMFWPHQRMLVVVLIAHDMIKEEEGLIWPGWFNFPQTVNFYIRFKLIRVEYSNGGPTFR